MADSRQLQIILEMQDKASSELKKVMNNMGGVGTATTKTSSAFGALTTKMVGAVGAYLSFKKAYEAFNIGVTLAADLETAEVGLVTLLGSTEKASSTIARLKEEAKRTPFEMKGLTQATQLLTSVTKDGNKSIDILLDVGEALAAMGKGQSELDRIIVNLQQISATGKATTLDVKQFAFAGIPIYEMLSEATGKYGEELADLVSSGGVTFELLTRMFDEANDEGGRFFNAFKNQSGTFNQELSNMKDAFGIFMAELVQKIGLFDALKNAMNFVSTSLSNYESIVRSASEAIADISRRINEKTGLIDALKVAWQLIWQAITEELIPAFQNLWEILQPLMPLIEFLAKLIGVTLLLALKAAVLVLANLFSILAKIINVITDVAVAVKDFFEPAINAMIEGIKTLVGWLKDAWDWLTKLASKMSLGGITSGLSNMASGAFNSVKSVFTPMASGGIVTQPTRILAGEAGPEAIIPLNKAGIGGGITVNVYGDISGKELVNKVSDGIMSKLRLNQRLAF